MTPPPPGTRSPPVCDGDHTPGGGWDRSARLGPQGRGLGRWGRVPGPQGAGSAARAGVPLGPRRHATPGPLTFTRRSPWYSRAKSGCRRYPPQRSAAARPPSAVHCAVAGCEASPTSWRSTDAGCTTRLPPPDGARAPSAARDDARTPSAARPGESGPLILQSTTVEPSTSLWEQVFPATTWASVLGGRTVTVTVEGGRATLLGARDGQRTELGRITAGRRAVSLAELEQDWLWVEPDGGGVDSVTWSIEADLALPPVTVVVPTYRREQDAVAQVRRFTQMGVVDAVVVIDQAGT